MAVSIRLRREGTKNRPYYKVVVADKRSPRDGKFIEIIGTYDPKIPGRNSTLNTDRVEYWISKGAQPSDTVRSLIKKNKKAEPTADPVAKTEQSEQPSVPEPSSPPAPPAEGRQLASVHLFNRDSLVRVATSDAGLLSKTDAPKRSNLGQVKFMFVGVPCRAMAIVRSRIRD